MLKMKKPMPKTPKYQEMKTSSNVEPLVDKEVRIHDLPWSYHLSDLCFDMYDRQLKGGDPFRFVESWLYYSVTPIVYYFPQFIS